ncbi:hypothetical protein CEP53_008928 [Fusarium sp. AF-6]|nr:hypothetical protein CEP53_008928 [Fusarium sp. AF-6]
MPKILILGATGYLGKRLADVLVRSGQHRVYGIARNQAKAQSLTAAEVIPVICPNPVGEPEAYLNAIREHHIDAVVDVAGANQDSEKFLGDVQLIGQERLSSEEPVNDLDVAGRSANTQPPALVAWRTDLENSILAASDTLDVAIVRPALIYGRESTIWTPFILPLLQATRIGNQNTVEIPLRANAKPGLVHVDDVATGFKCAIEKLSLINGGSTYPVFDLATSQESMQGIFNALTGAWEFRGRYELVGSGDNLFAEAMSTTMRGSSDRAKQLLGWEPTRMNGFIANMDVYAAAFASQH